MLVSHHPQGRCRFERPLKRFGKLATLVLFASTASLPKPASADAPVRCLSLDDQAPIGLGAVPAERRAAAEALREQAAAIAAHRGISGPPVLVRLKSNDPGVVTLLAWVRDPAGAAAALLLYTSGLDQTHSLVDGSLRFVRSQNEPAFKSSGAEESGFSYQFFDRASYHIHLSDTVTTNSSTRTTRPSYRQKIATGFSYGGIPGPCRTSD